MSNLIDIAFNEKLNQYLTLDCLLRATISRQSILIRYGPESFEINEY